MRLPLVLISFVVASCQCAPNTGMHCKVDADCPNALICNTLDTSCVQCIDDNNCNSGLCLPDGTCGACGPGAPCQQGYTCGANGQCTPGCDSPAAGCQMGYCVPGAATCVECLNDMQCGAGRICDPTHICRMGCSGANPTCLPGTVCDVDAGTCVGCLTNANCTQPPVCDPATKSCVGCLGPSDCHGQTPLCDPTTLTCVECTLDNDCGTGRLCVNHACVTGCSAQHPSCAPGLVCDTANSACVACANDGNCGGTTPKCDPASHTCKPCLPGAADNCPMGEYCRPDFVCERGCKTNSDCPSGMCVNHSCASCTADMQCQAGLVCQGGTCINACSASNPCGMGKSCCNMRCVDLQNDPANCNSCGMACNGGDSCCGGSCVALNTMAHCGGCGGCAAGQDCCGSSCTNIATPQHCGSCGNACAVDQFCDGTMCQDIVFPNFCANKKVYAIHDGIALDNGATDVLASTIIANCSSQTTVQTGSQTNPAWVDQDAGTLLLGAGSTVVTAGGPFADKPVKWLERTSKATKVYFSTSGTGDTFYYNQRSDGGVIVTVPQAQCTPHHDALLIELVADPTSGTLVLLGYGMCVGGYGTNAAAWFYANVMLPMRASYPDSWYVFQWDDTNMDSLPNAGDSFVKVASGQ